MKPRAIEVSLGRLRNGEWISGVSAILLFVFTFFEWYRLEASEQQSNLLGYLQLFDREGGNAWQTLEVLPGILLLVSVFTVGVVLLRVFGLAWRSNVPPGAVVCVVGGFAALLILARIVFPPDLGHEVAGATFEAVPQVGIFLALAAACGVAFGGYRAMREWAGLRRSLGMAPHQLKLGG